MHGVDCGYSPLDPFQGFWYPGTLMKEAIHPFYPETTITCACGTVIETRATKENLKIDVCSSCHPFFTGKAKLLDTEGRVERFLNKYKKK